MRLLACRSLAPRAAGAGLRLVPPAPGRSCLGTSISILDHIRSQVRVSRRRLSSHIRSVLLTVSDGAPQHTETLLGPNQPQAQLPRGAEAGKATSPMSLAASPRAELVRGPPVLPATSQSLPAQWPYSMQPSPCRGSLAGLQTKPAALYIHSLDVLNQQKQGEERTAPAAGQGEGLTARAPEGPALLRAIPRGRFRPGGLAAQACWGCDAQPGAPAPARSQRLAWSPPAGPPLPPRLAQAGGPHFLPIQFETSSETWSS